MSRLVLTSPVLALFLLGSLDRAALAQTTPLWEHHAGGGEIGEPHTVACEPVERGAGASASSSVMSCRAVRNHYP